MLAFSLVLYIVCSQSWVSGQAVFPQDDNTCHTSRNEPGSCVEIRSCNYMVQLLRSGSRNPEVVSYLQKSTCGFSGNYPLICCPNNVNNNVIAPKVDAVADSSLPKRPQCGLSNVTNSRIVGGAPASLHEFPFMAVLGYRNTNNPNTPKWLCGGTLITNKHVLTAAHCVFRRNDLYLVRLGELVLFDENDGTSPEDILITKIKMHENFNSNEFTNDIAILTLEKSPTKPWIWPICLPLPGVLGKSDFVGEFGIVTGWGSLYFDGPRNLTLHLTGMQVVKEDRCKPIFKQRTVIDDRVFCALWTGRQGDTCQGDSGGPFLLTKKENGKYYYYQIGVVSYGLMCAQNGYPAVYTNITKFIDWIEKNIA